MSNDEWADTLISFDTELASQGYIGSVLLCSKCGSYLHYKEGEPVSFGHLLMDLLPVRCEDCP